MLKVQEKLFSDRHIWTVTTDMRQNFRCITIVILKYFLVLNMTTGSKASKGTEGPTLVWRPLGQTADGMGGIVHCCRGLHCHQGG